MLVPPLAISNVEINLLIDGTIKTVRRNFKIIKMKPLFITATDTDIGKTYVCAGLAHSLKKSGTLM